MTEIKKRMTLDEQIKSELSDYNYKRYNYFYNYAYKMNFKATDSGFTPIDDDMDKRREIKLLLRKGINSGKDNEELFKKLNDLLTNLDVIETEELEKYIIIDDTIYKKFTPFPFETIG